MRLAEIKTTGVVIGLTSSGHSQLEVLRYALDVDVEGLQIFDLFQVTYNVMDQSLAVLCNDLRDKKVVIKEAMANGRVFRNKAYPNQNELYAGLEVIAQKYKVGIDAVALRFCMDTIQPFVVLSGAASPGQIADNLKAYNFKLSADEIEELKAFGMLTETYWQERKQMLWN